MIENFEEFMANQPLCFNCRGTFCHEHTVLCDEKFTWQGYEETNNGLDQRVKK